MMTKIKCEMCCELGTTFLNHLLSIHKLLAQNQIEHVEKNNLALIKHLKDLGFYVEGEK